MLRGELDMLWRTVAERGVELISNYGSIPEYLRYAEFSSVRRHAALLRVVMPIYFVSQATCAGQADRNKVRQATGQRPLRFRRAQCGA
jgi:hypothetical protein